METSTYKGVLLLHLLNRAKIVDGPAKGAHLRHTIEVVSRDGYTVALSIGELEPAQANKMVLVAYQRNGTPAEPAGSVQLVVPGDHHAARNVHNITRITVK